MHLRMEFGSDEDLYKVLGGRMVLGQRTGPMKTEENITKSHNAQFALNSKITYFLQAAAN